MTRSATQHTADNGRPMARRLLVRGRSSGGALAASRCARGRGRVVRAALCERGAVRTEPRVSAHRHVSAQSPLRHERHAARSALHELGARIAPRRLRSGAVRLHAYRAGSALHRARRSAPGTDEGILPGIKPVVDMATHCGPWREWLKQFGYRAAGRSRRDLRPCAQRTTTTPRVPRPSLYSRRSHRYAVSRAERDGLHRAHARANGPQTSRVGRCICRCARRIRRGLRRQPYHARYPLRALPAAVRRDDVDAESAIASVARGASARGAQCRRTPTNCGIACCRRAITA